jgi:aspartate ammonia-lyase
VNEPATTAVTSPFDAVAAATGVDGDVRIEHDLIGEKAIPTAVYYGVHTARSLENFPISAMTIAIYPHLVTALAHVKSAAAAANRDLGVIDSRKAQAIIDACAEIAGGALHAQFVVDPIQGGAGTSTNMNANEVIANRALELLGHVRGEYEFLHPVEAVNMSQSTNDVYPTAARIAVHLALDELLGSMSHLRDTFAGKGIEFADVLKVGRTQLQDAVPMTLGQEFTAFALTLDEDIARVAESRDLIREINLGGTAIGTGLNAPAGYQALACGYLAALSGVPVIAAADAIEATPDVGALVQVSGVLKRVAVKISKTCSDLRLLSSGPRAGFGEIALPAVQAGSSIMPGKVNPVIPEVVNQIAFEVVGNDVTIAMAANGGQLQLNAFEPIIFKSLFASISHLTAGLRILADRCVVGITANRDILAVHIRETIGVATALNPVLGYEVTTAIAQEALTTHVSVADLAVRHGYLTREQVDDLLSPSRLATPHRVV